MKKQKQKAIFLDRDGTINLFIPGKYILRPQEVRLIPGVPGAIRVFNRLGYLVIVITNQGAIGRAVLTEKKLDEIHAIMIRQLAKGGAKIDGIYYCPHHPEATLPRYAIRCTCRKPKIGMILKARRRFNIDKQKSFFIGDATSDILTGKRAGLRAILVATGYGGKDGKYKVKPDFMAEDLGDAARFIKDHDDHD